MKCPLCNTDSNEKPIREWSYGKFKVSRYECPNCKEKFNYYSSEDGKSFTIPRTD